jgi:hypothetical protein
VPLRSNQSAKDSGHYLSFDAEADRLCNAQRYERSAARRDTRAGHYERNLQTKARHRALIEELPDSATASAHAFMSSTGSRPPHLPFNLLVLLGHSNQPSNDEMVVVEIDART